MSETRCLCGKADCPIAVWFDPPFKAMFMRGKDGTESLMYLDRCAIDRLITGLMECRREILAGLKPEDSQWLIWSNEYSSWWGPASRGYTQYREKAGRYSFEEACRIVGEANFYFDYKAKAHPKETMLRDE